jgi:hypothetical protein
MRVVKRGPSLKLLRLGHTKALPADLLGIRAELVLQITAV